MHRVLRYAVLLVSLLLAQVFVLDGLRAVYYVSPMLYIGFVLLLPMDAHPAVVLLSGALSGLLADLGMGTAGLNSIAAVAVAFVRPYLLMLTVGRTEMREGGVPSPRRVGVGRFSKYAALALLLFCLIYFSFEALSLSFYYVVLLKTLASAAVSFVLFYAVALLFDNNRV